MHAIAGSLRIAVGIFPAAKNAREVRIKRLCVECYGEVVFVEGTVSQSQPLTQFGGR